MISYIRKIYPYSFLNSPNIPVLKILGVICVGKKNPKTKQNKHRAVRLQEVAAQSQKVTQETEESTSHDNDHGNDGGNINVNTSQHACKELFFTDITNEKIDDENHFQYCWLSTGAYKSDLCDAEQ